MHHACDESSPPSSFPLIAPSWWPGSQALWPDSAWLSSHLCSSAEPQLLAPQLQNTHVFSLLAIQKKLLLPKNQKPLKSSSYSRKGFEINVASPQLLYFYTHQADSSFRVWQSSYGLWMHTTLRQLVLTEPSPLQEPHIHLSGPFWQHLWWTF